MAGEPITRQEQLLNAIASGETANIQPITREEMFLAKLGGTDVNTPTPITRKEQFLMKAVEAMSGGSAGGGGDAGGNAEMFTGTFVLSEDTSPGQAYIPIYLKDNNSTPTQFLFLLFSDRTETQSSTQYIESLIRYVQYVDGVAYYNEFIYGYNKGLMKTYSPYFVKYGHSSGYYTGGMIVEPRGFNGSIAAGVTYRWYVWGDNLKQ